MLETQAIMNCCGEGMALQRLYCPPARAAAPVFGDGGNGERKTCSSSWLRKGAHRRAATVGLDERYTDGTRAKMGVRLASVLQCRVADDPEIYDSELQGFARRVAACNEGKERKLEFLPFMVEKSTLGYVHYRFAQHLTRFPEVFSLEEVEVNGAGAHGSVSLTRGLSSPEERTVAVQRVLEALKSEGLIPGWRDELIPLRLKYGVAPALLMERAAFPLFGAKLYGVHMNGYVNIDGEKHLWVAKRSDSKQTFPGKLDHIVAGGQPYHMSAKDNLIKECDEEAGISSQQAEKAVAVGAVSYEGIMGEIWNRAVLFCYDLELPLEFEPYNKDGEVQSFYKLPTSEVFDIINKTDRYKPNCALVVIDFFIRHGYITPEQKGYLSLLQSLHIGEL